MLIPCPTCGGFSSPITPCVDCKGVGNVEASLDPTRCNKPLDRYGVAHTCGRPVGHDGQCMTWSEWVSVNQQSEDTIIPAG